MSDTQPAKTDLQRRRELTAMTKVELIDYIIGIQDDLAALSSRIDAAYGNEP